MLAMAAEAAVDTAGSVITVPGPAHVVHLDCAGIILKPTATTLERSDFFRRLLLADGGGPHYLDRDADQVRLYLAWLRDAHRWLQVQETRTLYHVALEADYFCDAELARQVEEHLIRRNGLPKRASGILAMGDHGSLDFSGSVVGYDPFAHAARVRPDTVYACSVILSAGSSYQTTLHRGAGGTWYADGNDSHGTNVVSDLLAVAGSSPAAFLSKANSEQLVTLFTSHPV